MKQYRALAIALFVTLVAVVAFASWVIVDLERQVDAFCSLKIVVPMEGPTELEAFPNRQRFPEWCGLDPHLVPETLGFET